MSDHRVKEFEEFYKKHYTWVYGFIRREVTRKEDAQDITSEIFAGILKNWDRIVGGLGEVEQKKYGAPPSLVGNTL